MPLITYVAKNFQGATLAIIDKANEIITEYADAGFDLTLRQLYVAEYGDESWELDALEPQVLTALIKAHIDVEKDALAWEQAVGREEAYRQQLTDASDRWDEVAGFLKGEL
jgi:hypothetical protein